METGPYSHLTKGTFLIASPEMDEEIYSRGVILICEHSPSGSFGIMINKIRDIEIPEELINLQEIENPRAEMRTGGPLQQGQMMLLHSSSQIPQQTLEVCEGVFLGGDLQFLQESLTDARGPHMRLCFGYAGWGPGQLEKEFLSGLWFLHPASLKHIFDTPPQKVWQTVLREMGGKYATLSMIPEDLSLN